MVGHLVDRYVASFFTLSGDGFAMPPRHAFTDRAVAAADAGYAGIGVHLNEFTDPAWNEWDSSEPERVLERMAQVLRQTGLDVVEVEFVGGWTEGPGNRQVARSAALVRQVAEMLSNGNVGGYHVSAGEFVAGEPVSPELAGLGLRELVRSLEGTGFAPALEAFAWSRLKDYDLVRDVIVAGGPGAGALVDVWHAYNTGVTPAQVAGGDLGPIAAVQLNGGYRVFEDFLANARSTRRLPGDGDLDGSALARAVLEAGFSGPWCVEVNYPEFRSLSAAEAAETSIEAARRCVAGAR